VYLIETPKADLSNNNFYSNRYCYWGTKTFICMQVPFFFLIFLLNSRYTHKRYIYYIEIRWRVDVSNGRCKPHYTVTISMGWYRTTTTTTTTADESTYKRANKASFVTIVRSVELPTTFSVHLPSCIFSPPFRVQIF